MYSLLIQNAQIVDGTGHEPWVGDVAVSGGKIVEVAQHIPVRAKQTVDARGLTLTPGFIDTQNHSDSYWQLFDNPSLDSMLLQGFTTLLIGNCGASLAPLLSREALLSIQKWHDLRGVNINWSSFDEYATELSRRSFGCNIASLVGYSTLRRGLVGDAARSLTPEETETLKRMLWDCLEAGAFGLSTGLSYAHEIIISELELYDLTQIVKAHNGLLSVHLRSESAEVVESVQEAVDLAMHTGVNIKLSHVKVRGQNNWHLFDSLIDTLENAFHRGANISFDVYPYDSVWQPLYTYLPKWAVEGGRKHLVEYLQSPVQRKKILSYLHSTDTVWPEMIIASTAHTLSIHGKTMGQVARNMGITSEEAVLEIIDKGGSEVLVFDRLLEHSQVSELLLHPLSMVASDGAGFSAAGFSQKALSNKLVHPRCFGTAPKFLREALAQKAGIGEAVRKLTTMPAKVLGVTGRGSIEVGQIADLVLLDLKELEDQATYKNPYVYPKGIKQVYVGGELAAEDGKVVKLKGKFLRKA